MQIKINLEKKHVYFLTALIILFIGITYAIAYGGTSPATMGHSAGEIGSGTIANAITITDAGDVGIGTTSPQARLQVRSGVTPGLGGWVTQIDASDGSRLGGFYEVSSGDAQFLIKDAVGTDKIHLEANGNSFFTSGNVGIGTTSPAKKLHIDANGNSGDGILLNNPVDLISPRISFGSTDTGTTYMSMDYEGTTDDVFRIYKENTNPYLAIKYATGNIGIGTTNPTAKLSIDGDSKNLVRIGNLGGGTWPNAYASIFNMNQGNNWDVLRVGTNLATAITVDKDAQVGIRTTDPVANLHVQAIGGENGIYTHTAENTPGYYIAHFASAGASRMYIRADGNVGIGTMTPQSKLTTNGDSYAASRSGGAIDIAEWTKTNDNLEAGDVVIIDNKNPEKIKKSNREYDTTVAGIISTSPHLTMGEEFKGDDAVKLALAGRVPVKATTENGAIQPGDLLTTSSLPGHAMKCDDKIKCVGAIVGKALEPLDEGHGKIMALLTLQ